MLKRVCRVINWLVTLELTQQTAWYMQRLRAAKAAADAELLQGILKADETYPSGKPHYQNKNNKRGRGSGGWSRSASR